MNSMPNRPAENPGTGASASSEETPKAPLVSIVIPMLNEREGLPLLLSTLQSAIATVPVSWEIIAVDDGSTDGTREILANELARFATWQALILSRNFGQQAAYRAGLEVSRGDAVIFLDADLQDPPELIPELIGKWQQGF